MRAVGAEAREAGFELVAEDEDLIFVEWLVNLLATHTICDSYHFDRFKLHMCPESMDAEGMRDAKLKPLPLKKTAVDVFADFLAYLFACTRRYILETHASGASLWNSVQQRIDFVISHPNGWEGPQQARLRQAAVRANLIPDTQSGHSRLHFVTEGEASLHFCINSGLAADVIEVCLLGSLPAYAQFSRMSAGRGESDDSRCRRRHCRHHHVQIRRHQPHCGGGNCNARM